MVGRRKAGKAARQVLPEVPGIEVLEQIGEGGSATVWRGRRQADGREVAVKVLGLSVGGRHEDLHGRETRAAGRLRDQCHPAIIEVLATGACADRRPYLVMEHLPGGSLSARLEREGPMGWDEASALAIRLCGALETAHRCGVLHRDVKPANVMADDDGRWKLVDFGVARLHGDPRTRTSHRFVTVSHAPPEAFSGARPHPTRDVWSVASTSFECITGHPPFGPNDAPLEVMSRLVCDKAPDLRLHGVPEALCRVFERALDKDPANRHQSALALADDLVAARRAAGAAPVLCEVTVLREDDLTVATGSLPPAPGRASAVAPRRRRTAPALGAVAALLVVVGAAGAVAVTSTRGVSGGGEQLAAALVDASTDDETAPPTDVPAEDTTTTDGDTDEVSDDEDATAGDEAATEADGTAGDAADAADGATDGAAEATPGAGGDGAGGANPGGGGNGGTARDADGPGNGAGNGGAGGGGNGGGGNAANGGGGGGPEAPGA
jgi:hypothetical protein